MSIVKINGNEYDVAYVNDCIDNWTSFLSASVAVKNSSLIPDLIAESLVAFDGGFPYLDYKKAKSFINEHSKQVQSTESDVDKIDRVTQILATKIVTAVLNTSADNRALTKDQLFHEYADILYALFPERNDHIRRLVTEVNKLIDGVDNGEVSLKYDEETNTVSIAGDD